MAPQYPIESVDNALKLLLLLGEQPQIRLSEATRYLGVASSTAHRLLAMLAYRGFVRQDPVSKAYLPGPALSSVAFAIFGRLDVPATALPVMRSLSERLRESIHVGMLDGANVRFVAAVEGRPRSGWLPGWGASCRRTAPRRARSCWPSCRGPSCSSCCRTRSWRASPRADRHAHRIGGRACGHPRTGLRSQSRGERGRRCLGCGSDTDPRPWPSARAQRRGAVHSAERLWVSRGGRRTHEGGQGDW